MQLAAPAYAKINLGLRVIGKRDDGYHDIETVFHRIDLRDEVIFEPSDGISVSSSSPEVPEGEKNICFEAARLLRESLEIREGVRITLEKRIPPGSGLGGGSSDAATVLATLPGFWNRTIDSGRLDELAARLGSDVPYFMHPGSAVGTGRGTTLTYFDLSLPFSIVVCSPGIRVATSWAYARLPDRHGSGHRVQPTSLIDSMEKDPPDCTALKNDFEETIFAEFPEILEVRNALLDGGSLCASLSGSGSSVFGLFRDMSSANKAAAALRRPGVVVSITAPRFRPPPPHLRDVS